MRSVELFLCLCLGAGCGGYAPGRLLAEPAARRLGCLEVAVERSGDPAAPAADPVITYRFGNRCRERAPVDLRRARVVAEYGAGACAVLRPYDPRGELRAAALAGRDEARETIEYVAPPWASGEPRGVCVDLSGISDRAAAAPEVCP